MNGIVAWSVGWVSPGWYWLYCLALQAVGLSLVALGLLNLFRYLSMRQSMDEGKGGAYEDTLPVAERGETRNEETDLTNGN